MRILYVGNSYARYNGTRSFFFTKRFYNGLIRNGHDVHFYDDRQISKDKSPLFGAMRKIGIQKANQKFIRTIKNTRPEAIIFSHIGVISSHTLDKIKNDYPDIRMAYLNVDAAFSPKNLENLNYMKRFCHAIFITTSGQFLLKQTTDICSFHYIPNVTDRSIDTGRAFELESPKFDIASFMHGEDNHKKDQVQRLSLAEQVAQIDGIKTCYHGFDNHSGLYGIDYFNALGQSAMTLCLNRHSCDNHESTPETRYMYSSDRTAHVMGNGSMAIMSTDFSLNKLYNDDEVVFFSSDEELIEKVSFYKNNPSARQKIAQKGWKKAHRDLNECLIMQYVIERLFDQSLSQDYIWAKEI